jgi:hypothetical protein
MWFPPCPVVVELCICLLLGSTYYFNMKVPNAIPISTTLIPFIPVGSSAVSHRSPKSTINQAEHAKVSGTGQGSSSSTTMWNTGVPEPTCAPDKPRLGHVDDSLQDVEKRKTSVDKADIDRALTRIRQAVSDLYDVTDDVVLKLLSVSDMLDTIQLHDELERHLIFRITYIITNGQAQRHRLEPPAAEVGVAVHRADCFTRKLKKRLVLKRVEECMGPPCPLLASNMSLPLGMRRQCHLCF